MISIRRWVAAVIPFIYALYLPVQSLLLPNPLHRNLEIFALCIYLIAVTPSLLIYSDLKLPLGQALYNLSAAVIMPALVLSQRDSTHNQSVGGWVVMGTAVLMTITAVRQQRLLAVIGTLALAIQILIHYGPIAVLTSGLVGAVVLVLAGLGVSAGMQRANSEVGSYRLQEETSRAQIAATTATRRERTTRLQEVLGAAIPMLSEIAELKTPLAEDRKREAKLLELILRDEIRGRNLLTPELKTEIQRLRSFGVEVAVLDEGGTDHLELTAKNAILNKAVEALQGVTKGRVTIRSPRGESFQLTVVATLPGKPEPLVSLRLSA